jgi:LmbE family N-acetylglucosaminyl deacetylase
MPSVLAIAAHPDDIEFVMAGTLLRLKDLGWELHYCNLADGCRGSATMNRQQCAATRLQEAKRAAAELGAIFHPPIFSDMEIVYGPSALAQVTAVVRRAKPTVVLTHSPIDYMEDHEQTCRLAVSAAFSRGMPNLQSEPAEPAYNDPVTVYHAQPHGNHTPLGDFVMPHFAVDTSDVIDRKLAALRCHACQMEWLDQSQGMNSYLQTMLDLTEQVGTVSKKFRYAEGWRRRQHWGFCNADDDPLVQALGDHLVKIEGE